MGLTFSNIPNVLFGFKNNYQRSMVDTTKKYRSKLRKCITLTSHGYQEKSVRDTLRR